MSGLCSSGCGSRVIPEGGDDTGRNHRALRGHRAQLHLGDSEGSGDALLLEMKEDEPPANAFDRPDEEHRRLYAVKPRKADGA
jgi:hypothetical protein